MYYISKVLGDLETWYFIIERLALTLVTVARKLRSYFLSHCTVVLTNHQIKFVLMKLEVSWRLVKWFIKLSEYDVCFQSRTVINAQTLADFIIEGIEEENPKEKE
ncbi:hypothetical protein ACH5RR_037507 [Cinchona calisaya]|uniref:Reverse transcriptase RNase H-like domain-containing protein n=1 Tax=Cinchona calisaya TaxID=153742 RepID=A0ABD2YBW7_9GENT